MTRIVSLERLMIIGIFLAVLVPVAARGSLLALPLYGIPLTALIALWMWRSLQEACLDSVRATALLPFVLAALLLGLSTMRADGQEFPQFFIWGTGLVLMLYANQNWQRTIDYRFVVGLAVMVLSVELAISLAQIATRSYVGNAVMYFGRGGDILEDVGAIAGGRVFRPVGTVGLPNMLSILIVMMSSIVFPVIIGAAGYSRWFRIYAAALVLMGFMVLVFSTSRGSIIAMLAVPVLFAGLHATRTLEFSVLVSKLAPYILVGLLACVLIAGAATLLMKGSGASPFIEGLVMRLEGVERSARFRLFQYWQSIAALGEYALLGMGFGESDSIWNIVDSRFPGKEDFSHPPHNSYIILALEGGLVAGVAYAAALLWMVVAYPVRIMLPNSALSGPDDLRTDALYIAFFIFAAANLIYIAPMFRTLWPVGCFLIGLMQAQLFNPRRGIGSG